jgi:hypothetical protein
LANAIVAGGNRSGDPGTIAIFLGIALGFSGLLVMVIGFATESPRRELR